MAVKLADTLAPMGDFEIAQAKDISVTIDGSTKMLQTAIDNGEIGGGSSTFVGLKADWESLLPTEKAKYEFADFTDDVDGALIDDTTAHTNKVYSSSKVESLVNDWEDISSQCTVPSGVTQETERPLKVYKNGKMIWVNFSPKIMWDGVKEYIDVLNISGVTFAFEQRFFAPFQGMEGGVNCLATNSKISIYKFDLFSNRIGVGYEKLFYINVFLLID